MSEIEELDMFSIPADDKNGPKELYRALVARCREFQHLRDGEPRVAFMLRHFEKIKAGRVVLGTCYMPSVQGELKPMFEWMLSRLLGSLPDFLIVLDADYWEAADDREREILIFHELMHCGQALDKYGAPKFNKDTGDPVWTINGHDVEEFTATVRRYGAYDHTIKAFIDAADGLSENSRQIER